MRRLLTRARPLAVALVAAGLVAGIAVSAPAAASKPVVEVVKNAKLGASILATRNGMTLYSLSAETHGRFICTDKTCLSVWKPLVVARGTKPTGVPKLATIRRPDGRTQVTYRGLPLYSFAEDRKQGDVKGNGFKDVGTWRVATTTKAKAAPAPPPSGGYGYGSYGG
jgi:predicted lipoprotein with Yx(FWY)xxD motif